MSESGTVEDDPLRGLDPRRRAALEQIRREFKEAGGDRVSLSDELIAERRLEAAAEDGTSTGREWSFSPPPPASRSSTTNPAETTLLNEQPATTPRSAR